MPCSSPIRPHRRRVLLGVAAGMALAVASLPVQADAWPTRALRLVVPYPPGGAADTVARLYADRLGQRLQQTVVVENRPGAGTAIAAEHVAKSPADGYTLALVPTGQLTILPHVVKDLRFDPLAGFAPVSLLASTAVVIAAAPGQPASSLLQVVEQARARPGQLTYSSSGSTTIIHLAGEYFAATAGISLQHVPFKGSAPAVAALLGNQVDLAFDTLTILAPQIKAGKIKGIAIAAAERSPVLPDLPTVAELGYPGFEVRSWFGLAAPAGTPAEVVQRLNREVAAVAAQPALREALAAQGLTPWPSSAAAFAQQIRADHARYGQVVQAAGIRFD